MLEASASNATRSRGEEGHPGVAVESGVEQEEVLIEAIDSLLEYMQQGIQRSETIGAAAGRLLEVEEGGMSRGNIEGAWQGGDRGAPGGSGRGSTGRQPCSQGGRTGHASIHREVDQPCLCPEPQKWMDAWPVQPAPKQPGV